MNRVLLTGRLTRDPELRTTSTGKTVAQFAVATHEYVGGGKEKSEFHTIVVWGKLAETCGRYLGKGQQVAIEGRLQTRSWDDANTQRHWKTEIVAAHVEMLAGRRRRDYSAEAAADALEAQAVAAGVVPDSTEPAAEDVAAGGGSFSITPPADEDDEEDELLEEAVAA
jgi:single-strand DNA-binding protein